MSKPWHRWPPGFRQNILERDNHTCRIQLPGCTLKALEVDHILPPRHGGAWFDPTNCRAACPPCNRARNRLTTQPTLTTTRPPEHW